MKRGARNDVVDNSCRAEYDQALGRNMRALDHSDADRRN